MSELTAFLVRPFSGGNVQAHHHTLAWSGHQRRRPMRLRRASVIRAAVRYHGHGGKERNTRHGSSLGLVMLAHKLYVFIGCGLQSAALVLY